MSSGLAGPRVPPHQVTTRHLGAAYPLLASGALTNRGIVVGRNLLGGTFVYDPFELYAEGLISNPNMVVLGQIGRGKSAFIKSYLWRQAVFGRRAWVVDPKGEYAPLARHWQVRPIALRPGGSVRLNPLDLGATRDLAPVTAGKGAPDNGAPGSTGVGGPVGHPLIDHPLAEPRQMELCSALATASLGREVQPRERTAIELALGAAAAGRGGVTLPALVERMLDPAPEAPGLVHTDRQSLIEDGRDVALELRRLVHGDLRGMFDGPTTPGLDLSGPLVVLDLSALYESSALGVLMTCATAWLQAAATREGRRMSDRLLLVVDEAWAILTRLAVARWLQASWKLSRARGIANMAVLHRVSDLTSVGHRGSEQVGLAEGLLADSETRVIYGQPPGEVDAASRLLSLTSTEAELLPQLRRGVALWKVGSHPYLVEHRLSQLERGIVDTDAEMVGGHVTVPPTLAPQGNLSVHGNPSMTAPWGQVPTRVGNGSGA